MVIYLSEVSSSSGAYGAVTLQRLSKLAGWERSPEYNIPLPDPLHLQTPTHTHLEENKGSRSYMQFVIVQQKNMSAYTQLSNYEITLWDYSILITFR